MKNTKFLIFAAFIILGNAGCQTAPKVAYSPEVRKMSDASNTLFNDALRRGIFVEPKNKQNKLRQERQIQHCPGDVAPDGA